MSAPRTLQLEPGATFREYRIERRLAAGGQAVVYVARHMLLDRLDVLKFLRHTTDDANARVRMLAEAKFLATVSQNPNFADYGGDLGARGDNAACSGAAGGNGGFGGSGAGGLGGHAISIAASAGASVTLDAPDYQPGTPGAGGPGGDNKPLLAGLAGTTGDLVVF